MVAVNGFDLSYFPDIQSREQVGTLKKIQITFFKLELHKNYIYGILSSINVDLLDNLWMIF